MNKVLLVDSNDNPIGETEKLFAHNNCLLHRAVSVFIFNSKMEMLIQKRADCKYHSPNLWTNATCTHPQINETPEYAGIRRLFEEMHLSINKIHPLFSFTYKEQLGSDLWEHEYDHVFYGISDEKPIPNPHEVSDYKYVNCNDLILMINNQPEDFTVWFKKIINRVINEMFNF